MGSLSATMIFGAKTISDSEFPYFLHLKGLRLLYRCITVAISYMMEIYAAEFDLTSRRE